MRKVLTIAVAALMVVALVGAANAAASETTWRFQVRADDGAGGGFGAFGQVGVAPTATDGVDATTIDTVYAYGTDLPGETRYVAAALEGDTTTTYLRNIQSTASPYSYAGGEKIYNLLIGAGASANNLPIRLQFSATNTVALDTVGGLPYVFFLRMMDNKGVAGAPANGTVWNIPIPAASTPTGTIFWSMDTALDVNDVAWGNLPMRRLSAGSHSAMLAEGYQMQFVMATELPVVPEPSSMLALGTGLTGLIGFAIRRRRA